MIRRAHSVALVRTLARGVVSLGAYAGLAAALVVSSRRIEGPSAWSFAALTAWFDRQPVGAAFRGLAAIGLIVVLYLVVSTLAVMLTGVARAARCPRLGALAEAVTVPVVRRGLAAMLGVGITVATASPAHATRRADPSARMTTLVEASAPEPVATMRALTSPPTPTPIPGLDAGFETTWTISPGDHLWGLAAEALAEARDHAPTDAEVAAYLERVVAANRERLAVPDHPDLVFPGQVFLRPPAGPG